MRNALGLKVGDDITVGYSKNLPHPGRQGTVEKVMRGRETGKRVKVRFKDGNASYYSIYELMVEADC